MDKIKYVEEVDAEYIEVVATKVGHSLVGISKINEHVCVFKRACWVNDNGFYCELKAGLEYRVKIVEVFDSLSSACVVDPFAEVERTHGFVFPHFTDDQMRAKPLIVKNAIDELLRWKKYLITEELSSLIKCETPVEESPVDKWYRENNITVIRETPIRNYLTEYQFSRAITNSEIDAWGKLMDFICFKAPVGAVIRKSDDTIRIDESTD